MLFLYHLTWTVLVAIFLPFVLLGRGGRIRERLGLSLTPPHLPATGAVWIHALSVGEVVSALPLVRALKRDYPSRHILFSVTTRQGMEVARRELAGEGQTLIAMPFDFWWSLRRIIRHFSPKLFILVETDLWPGLLHLLRRRGIKSLLINGRISPETLRSYERCRFLVRKMFGDLELCLMQSNLDRERLLQVGVEAERVETVGNIKFDRQWRPMDAGEHDEWHRVLRLQPGDPVWVAGSTHAGEEEIVLDVFLRLRNLFPRLRLIIAPRRIERAGEICDLGTAKGLKPVLRTMIAEEPLPFDVVIVNTLGELGRVYGIAEVSFVGGSLVPAGGHNLLEPAYFGRPVLFGPHTEDFVLMSESLMEAGGGGRIKDEEDLFLKMRDLLADPRKAEKMGRKARTFVETNRGALGRVLDHLNAYL